MLQAGEAPEETLSLKGGRITFYGWRQLVQLAAIRGALKTGFDLHMHVRWRCAVYVVTGASSIQFVVYGNDNQEEDRHECLRRES